MGMIRTLSHQETGARLVRRVEGIMALHGCSRLLLGAVLAHELGHAWVFQKGIEGLSPMEEEGFCELCSHQWLAGSTDPRAAYLRERIAKNPDPVYGHGFRTMQARAGAEGIRGLAQRLLERRS